MSCCCSLAGTAACLICNQRQAMFTDWTYPHQHTDVPWWIPGYPEVPVAPSAPAPKKTTVEEYDKDGKLIRRVITTQE